MSSDIPLKDLVAAVKDVVDCGKEATFTPEGVSMRPMLYGGRDEIVLVKPEFPLKNYDLPLYIRNNGTVVLHRVIKVKTVNGKTVYTMRGDNTFENEKGISNNQIVAVVSRFKRNGKWYSSNHKGYLCYVKIWNLAYPVRKLIRLVFVFLYKVYKKIKTILKKGL